MIRQKHRRARRQRSRSQARAATTAQILGGMPSRVESVPAKWKPYYARLIALRDHLLAQRQDLSKDAREEKVTFSEHMADAGTDSYDRDFALSMLSAEHDALYEVDEAIHRIRRGTYGFCEVTGKRIEPERLNALPWTRFSAEAARNLEQQGELKRAHLAKLGSVTAPGAAEAQESAREESAEQEPPE